MELKSRGEIPFGYKQVAPDGAKKGFDVLVGSYVNPMEAKAWECLSRGSASAS